MSMRFTSKSLAAAAVATTLSIGLAACGDENSNSADSSAAPSSSANSDSAGTSQAVGSDVDVTLDDGFFCSKDAMDMDDMDHGDHAGHQGHEGHEGHGDHAGHGDMSHMQDMMSAGFGVLHNNTDKDLTLVGFETSLPGDDEASNEIHEVVGGVMKPKEGGIVIPAGGSYDLTAGEDHLMIMDYGDEIPEGEKFDVTLRFEDGSTAVIKDVDTRDQPTCDVPENY